MNALRRLRIRPMATAGFVAEAALGEQGGGFSTDIQVRARVSIGRGELAILAVAVVIATAAIVAIVTRTSNAAAEDEDALRRDSG